MTSRDPFQDILRLHRRIRALNRLLACHIMQHPPSESLHQELDRTKKWAEEIFAAWGLEDK